MDKDAKPLTEITEDALRILFREMGVVNTVRFLNQFVSGLGDYTQERAENMRNETVEELAMAIEEHSHMGSTK